MLGAVRSAWSNDQCRSGDEKDCNATQTVHCYGTREGLYRTDVVWVWSHRCRLKRRSSLHVWVRAHALWCCVKDGLLFLCVFHCRMGRYGQLGRAIEDDDFEHALRRSAANMSSNASAAGGAYGGYQRYVSRGCEPCRARSFNMCAATDVFVFGWNQDMCRHQHGRCRSVAKCMPHIHGTSAPLAVSCGGMHTVLICLSDGQQQSPTPSQSRPPTTQQLAAPPSPVERS